MINNLPGAKQQEHWEASGREGLILVDLTPLTDAQIFDRYARMLPSWRIAQLARVQNPAHRRHVLGGGIALMEAMQRAGVREQLGGVSPVPGPGGKPEYPGSGFYFNLSHGGTYAVCAYGERPVGVDIERPGRVKQALLSRLCRPGEWELLHGYLKEQIPQSPDTGQEADFLTGLWTMKESVMKFFGRGLALDPREIRLYPPGDLELCPREGVEESVAPRRKGESNMHLKIAPDPAAVCYAQVEGEKMCRLSLRFIDEYPLTCCFRA